MQGKHHEEKCVELLYAPLAIFAGVICYMLCSTVGSLQLTCKDTGVLRRRETVSLFRSVDTTTSADKRQKLTAVTASLLQARVPSS